MKETFRGFLSPSFTQVPDEFFDALLPSLSESELKVLLYIIRHTIGLKKQKASISIKQFQKGFPGTDKGCGMEVKAVRRAVNSLEKRRIISIERTADESGMKTANSYSINVAY